MNVPQNGGSTPHTKRVDQLRERIKRVLPHIDVPSRGYRTTVYSVFAERAWKIAQERGLPLSKSKTIQPKTGVPKDLPNSFKRFINGMGAFERTLDVYELACIEFEQELRQRREEARASLKVVPDLPESPEAASEAPVAADGVPVEEAVMDYLLADFGRAPSGTPVSEFRAAELIVGILEDRPVAQMDRIMGYVGTWMDAKLKEEQNNGA